MFVSRVLQAAARTLITAPPSHISLPTVLLPTVLVPPVYKNEILKIYIDESFKEEGGKKNGGFGIFWEDDHPYNCCGMVPGPHLSPHRAEVYAALVAIRIAILISAPKILLMSDSKYAKCGIEDEKYIEMSSIARDLLKSIHFMKRNVDVSVEKVKAHSGNYGNNRADKLATKGRMEGHSGIIFPNAKIWTPPKEILREQLQTQTRYHFYNFSCFPPKPEISFLSKFFLTFL